MHSFFNLLIQFGLIALPMMVLMAIKALVSSIILRLACAMGMAIAAGASSRYLASEYGWQPVLRSDRSLSQIGPEALFWIFSGTVFSLLLIIIFSHGQPQERLHPMKGESLAETHPPDPPEDSLKARKMVFWLMTTIYGLALLAWPVLAFIALFIFGDKRGDPIFNVAMAVSIWIYPVLFIIGFRWGHYRRNLTALRVLLKTSICLLSATWHFLIPGCMELAWHLLTEKKISFAELESKHQALKDRLDPIYQSKRDAINNRNPQQDARKAIEKGEVAYLPSTPGGDVFPGLVFPRISARLRLTITCW